MGVPTAQTDYDGNITTGGNMTDTKCDKYYCDTPDNRVNTPNTDKNGHTATNTSNRNVKGIKLMHLIIHHIQNKLCNGEIKIELDNLDVSYHVLGFRETFLNEDISDNKIEIPGYSLHRKDRLKKAVAWQFMWLTN